MKFYILNQVWGTNFIPDDSADFGFKIFFIPKTTILLLYIYVCGNGFFQNIVTTSLFMTLLKYMYGPV